MTLVVLDYPAKQRHKHVTEWRDDEGRLHRDDGPAVLHEDGSQAWFRHGKLHREIGPAYVDTRTGVQSWWLDGVCVGEDDPLFVAQQHQ